MAGCRCDKTAFQCALELSGDAKQAAECSHIQHRHIEAARRLLTRAVEHDCLTPEIERGRRRVPQQPLVLCRACDQDVRRSKPGGTDPSGIDEFLERNARPLPTQGLLIRTYAARIGGASRQH